MGKLITAIKAMAKFVTDKERITKAKLSWAAIQGCYKQMNSAADELKVSIDNIWQNK